MVPHRIRRLELRAGGHEPSSSGNTERKKKQANSTCCGLQARTWRGTAIRTYQQVERSLIRRKVYRLGRRTWTPWRVPTVAITDRDEAMAEEEGEKEEGSERCINRLKSSLSLSAAVGKNISETSLYAGVTDSAGWNAGCIDCRVAKGFSGGGASPWGGSFDDEPHQTRDAATTTTMNVAKPSSAGGRLSSSAASSKHAVTDLCRPSRGHLQVQVPLRKQPHHRQQQSFLGSIVDNSGALPSPSAEMAERERDQWRLFQGGSTGAAAGSTDQRRRTIPGGSPRCRPRNDSFGASLHAAMQTSLATSLPSPSQAHRSEGRDKESPPLKGFPPPAGQGQQALVPRPALTVIIPERENGAFLRGVCRPTEPEAPADPGRGAARGTIEPVHRKARRAEIAHRLSCSDLMKDDEWLQVRQTWTF